MVLSLEEQNLQSKMVNVSVSERFKLFSGWTQYWIELRACVRLYSIIIEYDDICMDSRGVH